MFAVPMTNDPFGSHHVVLSGCSGGGKSTLLAELSRRGFPVVPEPGRRIVEEELQRDGSALPWIDLAAFANRAIEVALNDRHRLDGTAGWVFFDRSIVDAVAALEHATGNSASAILEKSAPYHRQVFITPPWPEIFASDRARQHRLNDAIAEYERLLLAYSALGYEMIHLPKVGVEERTDLLLHYLR